MVSQRVACSVATLESPHVSAAAATLAEAFDYESLYSWSRPLGLPHNRFAFWLEHMYLPERCSNEPKSLVVDGGASGVLTLEDMNASKAEEDPQSPPGMAAIDGLLDACKAQFAEALGAHGGDTGDTLGRHGYFAFLGVAQSARRRGVGAELVKRACVELKSQGYVYGIAFCTSHVSAALFAAQGFQRWGGVHYHRFAMPDGSHPFASLPDDECAVMVRDLRA